MKIAVSLTGVLVACTACGIGWAQGARSELKPIAFSTIDANKDGKVSLAEARADPGLYEAFEKLDANHDGFLTPEEYQLWPRALRIKDPAVKDETTVPSGSAGAQHMPPN